MTKRSAFTENFHIMLIVETEFLQVGCPSSHGTKAQKPAPKSTFWGT